MKLRMLYVLGVAMAWMTSCESVAEDDRYIPIDKPEAKRGVLIEDFTGQMCVNCPNAHATIHELQNAYSQNIIPVAIHAGNFGIPVDKGGLMQPEGNEYATKWNIEAYPSAVINRQGSVLDNIDQWTPAVMNVIWQEPLIGIETTATLKDGNQVEVSTKLTTSQAVDGKLQLWLLENGIVAVQALPDGSKDPQYTHDHVFRAAINGTWGEDVSLAKDKEETRTHTYTFDASKWKAENLSVVAFVYNEESGVLQAVNTNVTNQ